MSVFWAVLTDWTWKKKKKSNEVRIKNEWADSLVIKYIHGNKFSPTLKLMNLSLFIVKIKKGKSVTIV